MTIRVALNHQTHYRFDRHVKLWPHEIRLRPCAHARTPVSGYSLRIEPSNHFINWQQDAYGNWLARIVFPERSDHLSITVDLIADMTVINPFDFFIEEYAQTFPFAYPDLLRGELLPYLTPEPAGPRVAAFLEAMRGELATLGAMNTVDFLVWLNQRVQRHVGYIVRMEPGVQVPDQTLELALGSCRDSGWLLVNLLRHMGLAARFASGYLIQLTADVKALDGPSGTDKDFTDLHAWAEVYVPGAGWIGLDPTSGLLTGEGHIPLSCTAVPASAAPVIGATEPCEAHFDFSMSVSRIHEDPRVTRPYTDAQWQAIVALGEQVDADLRAGDVRLTMGGEPTFVSIDDMEGDEWNTTAMSPAKRKLAGELLLRLQKRFAPGALLHYGQGKWYPGEPLPRWSLGCYWRSDGQPLWRDLGRFADDGPLDPAERVDGGAARRFIDELAGQLGLSTDFVIPAHEDVMQAIEHEQSWPSNFDVLAHRLGEADERRRIARLIETGLGEVVGYVLPIKPSHASWRPGADQVIGWRSSPWPLRRERLFLIGGDSPMGLRLPLASLPWVAPEDQEPAFARDPFEAGHALPETGRRRRAQAVSNLEKRDYDPKEIVHTALCVQVREGVLHVFMPPMTLLEEYVDLLSAVEDSASALGIRLRVEGYGPPADERVRELKVTPDPGVIEVNIHPSASWRELVENTTVLYEEARLTRLGTEKFMLDGKHAGTGGGNHVVIGGRTPADSPCLRRPDLLMSLITYWQNHPALSYLFSGMFIGPTSQAPRVDEARHESLYELEIAFEQMLERLRPGENSLRPWLIDRLLRNLLVDLSGNTHRAEFCIDKLYSPDGPTGRLGLLEFRGFEMPPHPQMSLLQTLLLRALVARFWQQPHSQRLIRWGTELHDRFLLPHYVAEDMRDVVDDLRRWGYPFDFAWVAPFLEFRFPRFGTVVYQGIEVELRQAIEPWHVLGEQVSQSGTSRYVDSSVERLQVRVRNMTDGRHQVVCNGRPLPLTSTGVPGEFIAGVRYRAWAPPSALHPTIGVHSPLVFDVVDDWSGRSIGGCTYHVSHPGGRNFDTFPVNANEAEGRRFARFWDHGHTPGPMQVAAEGRNPDYPRTLDLRRAPRRGG
ncbi:MAG: transglutaminase family protein [Burkholderiaceae bacterium]